MNITYRILLVGAVVIMTACSNSKQKKLQLDNNDLVVNSGGKEYHFSPNFTVLYRDSDPEMAMRPSGIENVSYNVATWLVPKDKEADLKTVERSESQTGDGFDSKILDGKAEKRTPNYFNSGQIFNVQANSSKVQNDTVYWSFPAYEFFDLEAYAVADGSTYPKLTFIITPKIKGYFSTGFTGAPSFSILETEEIWQPYIWQEKRFPDNSYLTLAYRAPLPTAFVNDGANTIGVLAAPEEFPFDPLPIPGNSRFGILLRNGDGQVQPQLFAPVLGGMDSEMNAGAPFQFSAYLVTENTSLTYTYEKLARTFFGFGDYRKNDLASLNTTFENIIDYGNSRYGRYVDSLKGFEYSTDVPGAVKNVSSLNPLELSLVTDNAKMFDQRAYPMMEYMISREKFLFSLDREQKIQHPSRKLDGPIAPISELTSLYNIFQKKDAFLLDMAKKEYQEKRIRNLDVAETGETWINAMFLYKATGEETYLKKAKNGADEYLKNRVNTKQTDFTDPFGRGFFFWVAFTNRWIELLELYELTEEKKYLEAAREGARHYTLHTWMAPKIPDTDIIVNEGGKAPMYWYLEAKGHKQMYYPEENAPAWRLSEIGLTPESSSTSTGHRAIFMANYAPWMLRIGQLTDDDFLKQVAKAAIIGRYQNFPGYHINTKRTTAYEKKDYPLHDHLELSVNSFHYNHILPMASMLLDYLVTDVWARSEGRVDFPSEFIEGYAYLINKFYGSQKGNFYDVSDVQLWMPKGLLKIDNTELNYISGYKENQLLIAFANQSNKIQKATVTVNDKLVKFNNDNVTSRVWKENKLATEGEKVARTFEIDVEPNSITAIAINDVKPMVSFQDKILAPSDTVSNRYAEFEFGNGRAMLFNLGQYSKKAYIYLKDDDSVFKSVSLNYKDMEGNERTLVDKHYPFEFTVDLAKEQDRFHFSLNGITTKGKISKSKANTLGGASK